MKARSVRYRGVAAALLAGAVLRAAFVAIHPEFSGDALIYGDLAHNMLAHHVYGITEPGLVRPTLIRLPGYPLFLAACFVLFGHAKYLAVVWVQVVVDLITCWLLSLLAGRLWGERAGTATLWLAALCPFTANYAADPITETGSLFCVALALFALERWVARWKAGKGALGSAALVGVALAGAVLLRPDQGLLAAAVVPVMLWIGWRSAGNAVQRLLPAAAACLVIALPLAVWTARNERTMHSFQPLAPRYATDPGELISYGFQRWYRTWAVEFLSTVDVYWTYDGAPLRVRDLPPRAIDNAAQRALTERVYADYTEVMQATKMVDDEFAGLAAERVAAHPLQYYLLLPVAREANMWLRPRTELLRLRLDWWNVRAHPLQSLAAACFALVNAAYLALALVGLRRWRRARWYGRGPVAAAALTFVALRCALLLTLDNSEPRYTLECYPVVILLAALALTPRATLSEPLRPSSYPA